ncbi:retrovirus-related Pol polyprotein from transposon TNT 1-94 [Trichonephila clavipes]|nr:retrovirus-related Pol polyprotein from transposon TNT 1-94 [Trichonephila clavipes]
MKEGLIPSRYECPKCKKDMRLVERKGTIDGFEWRCRVQLKENPHFVCRSDCRKKESKSKVDGDAFVCTVEGVPESEVWIADSGASAHMTKHKNYFVDFTQSNSPKPVYVGNSDAIMAYGHGTVNIEIRINNKWERHRLTEVWYVPDISRNLFSIS